MLTKYASLEVAQILEVKGSREKITGAGLDKLSSYEDYRTDDGYLYTRVRAISSGVNKNHDGWPSEELAKSYLTFIGKPIFVDHNNSDPSRARGVIVDAKLHIENDFEKAAALDPYYASAPENHKPPTWVELLLEVDAKAFPHLAKAVVNDEIDGVSMGANVERSKCSHCANWATSPEEYCLHVLQKGADFDKYDDKGRKTTSAAYEDCYDIGFFEISYVFDPADETALDLGDKRHAISKVAARDDGTFDGDPVTCSKCGGAGQSGTGPCSTCNGRGVETFPKGSDKQAAGEYRQNWDNEVADRKWETRDPNACLDCEGRGCDYCGGTGKTDQVAATAPVTAPLKQYSNFALDKEGNVHYAGAMDMGGYGNGQAPTPAAAPSPGVPQPGMGGDANCPQCGTAMQDGVCPQCSAVPNEAPTGGDMGMGLTGKTALYDPSEGDGPLHETGIPAQPQGMGSQALYDQASQATRIAQLEAELRALKAQQPQQQEQLRAASFKLDKEGTVHYADAYMDGPMYGDDTMNQLNKAPKFTPGELDPQKRRENPSDADVQADADKMGETPRSIAEKAITLTGGDLESAVHIMQQWFPGMDGQTATRELQAADRANVFGGPPADEIGDPFLSHIAKDGTVHYAQPELPQSMMTTAPESVDTLRQEKICEVCGSDMDDGKCEVCGFEVPPEGFDNPDLEKAQQIAEQGAAEAPMPGGEAPPGAMAPPGGAPGGAGGSIGTPAPSGPPSAGGQPMARATSNTIISGETPVVTNERTAGKIRSNEKPIIPATKTVSDHPTTTTVTKEPTRLVQSNTKDNMTKTLTKAAVVAQMVKRGTNGVKTEAEAEALLKSTGLERLLAASPASDPAEHSQSVDQVGGEVDNAEGGVTHENVEKVQDIEKIPTMTWSDGKGDSLGQESPVTSESGDLGGPIGDALASSKQAAGFPDHEPQKVNLEAPLKEEIGDPTKTFKSDDFHITDPVTTEDSNEIGGPIGTPLSSVQRSQIVAQTRAHTFASLKLAEEMVNVGLIPEEQKWEQAAQLLEESPEQLNVRKEMVSKTRTAGLAKGKVTPSPKLPLGANSTRTASVGHDINDDNLGDAGLFR